MSRDHPLSALPGIDRLLAEARSLVQRHGHEPTVRALRAAVDDARAQLLAGDDTPVRPAALVARAAEALRARRAGPPRQVLNAAGVVVHTNLGRAALSEAALAAVAAAGGYCDLEYDLVAGRRGSRGARVDPLVAEACGAEDGLAVNNCAGALVLALAALAHGRGVVVSRGELVEIGGSFRLPQIMSASGARLVEVGTTNRTRPDDYRAGGDDIAAILLVHRSNYRIEGFTESPSVAAVAAVARQRGIPLMHDVGSGLLAPSTAPWLAEEPSMRGSLGSGADLVLCSGDKLLGGPQAGLIAGAAGLVESCRRHPLARALRLDKLRIAALVETLETHLRGRADLDLPTWRMLADDAQLQHRTQRLAAALGAAVVQDVTLIGGGSAPGAGVPGPVVRLPVARPDAVAAGLRAGDPPLIVRVAEDALLVDLRTVPAAADDHLTDRLRSATGSG